MENKQFETPHALTEEVHRVLQEAVATGAITEAEAGARFEAWQMGYVAGKLGRQAIENSSGS